MGKNKIFFLPTYLPTYLLTRNQIVESERRNKGYFNLGPESYVGQQESPTKADTSISLVFSLVVKNEKKNPSNALVYIVIYMYKVSKPTMCQTQL
jgi:hypothetical protein